MTKKEGTNMPLLHVITIITQSIKPHNQPLAYTRLISLLAAFPGNFIFSVDPLKVVVCCCFENNLLRDVHIRLLQNKLYRAREILKASKM